MACQFFDPKKTLSNLLRIKKRFLYEKQTRLWTLREICVLFAVHLHADDTAVLDDTRNRSVREDKSGVGSMNFWLVQCDTRTHTSLWSHSERVMLRFFLFFWPVIDDVEGKSDLLKVIWRYRVWENGWKTVERPYEFVEWNLRLCNLDKYKINFWNKLVL